VLFNDAVNCQNYMTSMAQDITANMGQCNLEDWETTFSEKCLPPSSRQNSDASSSVHGYQHTGDPVCVFKAEHKDSFCSTSNRILASENSVSRFPTPKACQLGSRERNQQDATNLMFIIKLLSQHVSGIIMSIIRRTRVCTAAYGVLYWL